MFGRLHTSTRRRRNVDAARPLAPARQRGRRGNVARPIRARLRNAAPRESTQPMTRGSTGRSLTARRRGVPAVTITSAPLRLRWQLATQGEATLRDRRVPPRYRFRYRRSGKIPALQMPASIAASSRVSRARVQARYSPTWLRPAHAQTRAGRENSAAASHARSARVRSARSAKHEPAV